MNAMRDRHAFVIEAWRPLAKGSLFGFAKVRLPSGIIVHDVTVHHAGERAWASPPGRPQVGAGGRQALGANGKALYAPSITFADAATRDRWSDAVVAALRERHPDALPAVEPELVP